MPDVLQRPLLVFAKPPFAEKNLQEECEQTDQQADRISAIRSKVQPEWEIDYSSDNGLCDVVRQALILP